MKRKKISSHNFKAKSKAKKTSKKVAYEKESLAAKSKRRPKKSANLSKNKKSTKKTASYKKTEKQKNVKINFYLYTKKFDNRFQ